MRRISGFELFVLVVVALICTIAVGCTSQASQDAHKVPHLSVSVTVGPKQRQAAFSIAGSGSGKADVALVLEDPHGNREQLANGLVEDGWTSGFEPQELAQGSYRYFIYAVPTSAKNVYTLPATDLVDKNLVDSGSFVIP